MESYQFYVYCHRKKTDKKCFYIGKGSGNRYKTKQSRNQYWWNIVNKHDFEFEILINGLTEQKAFELEAEFCKQIGYENLCNIREEKGWGGYTQSDETKEKIRKAQIGNTYNLGKKRTDENKSNMSLSKIGKPKPEGFGEKVSKIKLSQNIKMSDEAKQKMSLAKSGNTYSLGKPKSDETKQKICKSMLGKNVGKVRSEETKQHLSKLFTGVKRSEETKQKMSKIATGIPKPKVQKAVLQYDLKNNFIQEWSGIRFAGESLGIAWSNISACCRGIFKTAGGFIWKYK